MLMSHSVLENWIPDIIIVHRSHQYWYLYSLKFSSSHPKTTSSSILLSATMADDNTNACVICLESLCSADVPIGVTVPCGHCFHVECFAGWKRSRRGQSSIKCPMCNNHTTEFCRIFLDLGAIDDDDDGCSLSSVESDREDEESDTEDQEEEDSAESDTVDVISIDDDDDDVHVAKSKKKTAPVINIISDKDKTESEQKYRKMAKKLKIRVKMLESERQRLAQTQKCVLEQFEKLKREVQATEGSVETIRIAMGTLERQVESLRLDITRIRRERDEAKFELKAAKSKAQNAETSMAELKKQYSRDIERAHANSMTEVQTILNQHPKLTEANRRLREELLRKEDRIFQLESRLRPLHGMVEQRPDRPREQVTVKTVNSTSQAAKKKLLRDIQDQCDAEQQQRTHHPEHLDVKRRMKGKVSANAARMSRASEKPAYRSSTAVDALDAIDRMNPLQAASMLQVNKRPLERARLVPQNAPRKRASTSFAAAAADRAARDRNFGAKKRPQNDIRNMLTRR